MAGKLWSPDICRQAHTPTHAHSHPVPRLVVIYMDDIQAWLSFFLSSWWCGETLWSSLWHASFSYTFWLISSQFIFNWCLSKQNEYIPVEKPTHLIHPINNNILSPDLFIYINCTDINAGMNVIWNEWNTSKSRRTFVKLKGLHGCVPFCVYPFVFLWGSGGRLSGSNQIKTGIIHDP